MLSKYGHYGIKNTLIWDSTVVIYSDVRQILQFSNVSVIVPMPSKNFIMIKPHNTGHRNVVDKIMKTYESLFQEWFRGGNYWYVDKWRHFNTHFGGYSWASVYVLPLLEFGSWL